MIKWIREKKRAFSLQRFSKKAEKVRFAHAFVDLKSAKRIGFILNTTNSSAKDLIMLTDYIAKLETQHSKEVFVVELNYRRKSEPVFKETHRSLFVNPRHVNWLGFPSMEVLKDLNSVPTDILIDLDQGESLTSKFISGLSNARMRAGLHQEGFEPFYDLMLSAEGAPSLKVFLNQLEVYLNMLKKNE